MNVRQQIEELVLRWADNRGLTNPKNVNKQMLKLTEEVGELAGAIAKDRRVDIIDALGDIQVVLSILCTQLGIDADSAYAEAYETIKNRTGKTIDGVFIKDE